jgi:hypothetical protein
MYSDTKSAPPIFTKPRRVSVIAFSESLRVSAFTVIVVAPFTPS